LGVSKARLVITAVLVEGRRVGEVSAAYGVARSWIYELLARYRAEGDGAFEPRSRRPLASPSALPQATVELIIGLRRQLAGQGLDAGAHTIAWHLAEQHQLQVSPATIWRTLKKAGLLVAEPKKKPKSAYMRFAAELPNQMWQTDFERHEAFADPGGGGRPPLDACRSRRVEAGGRSITSAWGWLVEQSSTTTSRSSTARWGGLG
jgi:transposase